jgi:hypothetical protein
MLSTKYKRTLLEDVQYLFPVMLLQIQFSACLIIIGYKDLMEAPGGSRIVAHLVVKLCRIYRDISNSSGTPWYLGPEGTSIYPSKNFKNTQFLSCTLESNLFGIYMHVQYVLCLVSCFASI